MPITCAFYPAQYRQLTRLVDNVVAAAENYRKFERTILTTFASFFFTLGTIEDYEKKESIFEWLIEALSGINTCSNYKMSFF